MTSEDIYNKNKKCLLTDSPCRIVYSGINRHTCTVCNMPLIFKENILNGEYENQLNLSESWTWREYLVYGVGVGSILFGVVVIMVLSLG